MPFADGMAKRVTAGRGGSTFTTLAPRSSNVRAQSGPASTREKSTTLMPVRGPPWSAPLEPGEAGAVLAERGEPCLQIVRGPDGLLQFLHRIVGGEHALVRGDIGKLLGRGMRKGRAVRKFLGDGKRGLLERLVGADEVDEPPALERRSEERR